MIWELRHKQKISLLIEVSGLARSTYYYYAKQRAKPDKYSEIKEQITDIYHEIADVMAIGESRRNCTTGDISLTTRPYSG